MKRYFRVILTFWYVISATFKGFPFSESLQKEGNKIDKPNPNDSLMSRLYFLLADIWHKRWFHFSKNRISTCSVNHSPRGNEGLFPCACVCFVDFQEGKITLKDRRGNFRCRRKFSFSLRRFFVRRSLFWRIAPFGNFHSQFTSYTKAFSRPDSSLRLFMS